MVRAVEPVIAPVIVESVRLTVPVLLEAADLEVGPMLGLPLVTAFAAVVVFEVPPTVERRGFAGEAVVELVEPVEVNGLRAAADVVAEVRLDVLDDGIIDVRLAVEEAVAGFFSSAEETDLTDLCDALSERDCLGAAGVVVELVVLFRTVPVGGRVGGLFNTPVAVLETEEVVVLGTVVDVEEPMRFAGTTAFLTVAFFLTPTFAGDSASVEVSTSVLSPAVPSPVVSALETTSPMFSSLSLNTATLSPLSLIFLLNLSRSFVGDNHAK